MRTDLLQRAADLARRGEAFATAVVVRREPASSAQVGNTALVTETGEISGWLGGSCIQPTVVREALAAIRDALPRLIAIAPDDTAAPRMGVSVFPMTCHSGGTVEIYIEPVLPAPRLLVFGVSPAAQALARLGKAMGYAVDIADPEADATMFPQADRIVADFRAEELLRRPPSQRDRLFAVVATLGRRDEAAIRDALAAEPAYLGVVASPRRFMEMRGMLIEGGVPPHALDRIANPAGIDIGAKTPEEVALSILAQIVRIRRAAVNSTFDSPLPTARRPGADVPESRELEIGSSGEERDPVCGMEVMPAAAAPQARYGGRTYYFCCGGCRERFLAAPDRYAVSSVR